MFVPNVFNFTWVVVVSVCDAARCYCFVFFNFCQTVHLCESTEK